MFGAKDGLSSADCIEKPGIMISVPESDGYPLFVEKEEASKGREILEELLRLGTVDFP